MNYGKYFQLNLDASRMVDGITVYDYLDMPAYFGSPKAISPKYPLSVVITSDSVRFRLHYCAYKLDENDYSYNLQGLSRMVSGPETVHFQEVILELPYSNNSMMPVSTAVKQVYNTPFPSTKDNSYLATLLEWRYGILTEGITEIEKEMYHQLQKDMDSDRSYSNLWLMQIRQDDHDDDRYVINLKDSSGRYVAFLRKLLLDFMFDMNHSAVFQNSIYYNDMVSGLMSDYFFSALMHKCEYYYSRGLTLDAISEGKNTEHIREMYARKLFEAEKQWVRDIMNPLAEKQFQHVEDFEKEQPLAMKLDQWWEDNIKEPLHSGRFITRNSWFADPEEELRRVCFTMTEIKQNGKKKKHICNSETLAEYLGIMRREGISEVRSLISRWFLKRNAFSDVLHLHYCRYAHFFVPALVLLLAVIVLFVPSMLSQDFWHNNGWIGQAMAILWIGGILASVFYWIRPSKIQPVKGESALMDVRRRLVAKRMFWWMMVTGCVLTLFNIVVEAEYSCSDKLTQLLCVAVGLAICALLVHFVVIRIEFVKNVHLLLPRLVASIAAAWLTLAIGNELFSSFFDVIPSWLSCVILSIVVLIFILYEMNRIIPVESGLVKMVRSFELLVLSYVLSFVVGLFIVNFTGERFLERNNSLDMFFKEYVKADGTHYVNNGQEYYYDGPVFVTDSTTNMAYLKNLQSLKVVKEGHGTSIKEANPIVTYWNIGDYHFFVLRDFLIQFAFLAMFIGVFIQMIFEEKSITEI